MPRKLKAVLLHTWNEGCCRLSLAGGFRLTEGRTERMRIKEIKKKGRKQQRKKREKKKKKKENVLLLESSARGLQICLFACVKRRQGSDKVSNTDLCRFFIADCLISSILSLAIR